ncbi:MerR family transcriptional regulator [Streptomyces yaizuensis]|uniref:MerR family transcriptional regulator n=1 Tax=Streptomyces yaizuensis TaxID=2989713 RepID=A0ABQ5P743_9ACTN|nr:MerR family transcriptional regulator [Streptomyces sp. YSPA8]GLF98413.1 MerR family transcriptional regulator [Streptomyces sp. YSPA8]
MATGAREPTLTVDELAARAGVTVRTIRFYGTRGLLPPPRIGPRRVGHYGQEHLSRLALIEELQHQGMTLAAIERHLERLPEGLDARDLALHRALVASWAPGADEETDRAGLERRAGRALTGDAVDRLVAMGAVWRVGREPEDRFRVDPGLLRLGAQLLDVPIGYETILAARTVLVRHTQAAAEELTRIFRDEVWDPYREREPDPERVADMRSRSAPLRPMVVQALVAAFQRSLKEELRAAFGTADGSAGSSGPPGTPGTPADGTAAGSSGG